MCSVSVANQQVTWFYVEVYLKEEYVSIIVNPRCEVFICARRRDKEIYVQLAAISGGLQR